MTKTILFLCRHNSCRSQMAHGWAELLAAEAGLSVRVLSAGSEPAPGVNPTAIEVMREVGADISANRPRLLTPELLAQADVVVAVCGEEACPNVPGALYWGIEDPTGGPTGDFRETRRVIRERVAALLSTLNEGPGIRGKT